MFNEKDILARLQAGEDAQTIADEMAKMLNGVVDQKRKADAEAAEEAARKKRNEVKMIELQEILDDLHTWLANYSAIDAEDLDDIFDELDAETVCHMIEAVEIYATAMTDLTNLMKVPTPEVKKHTAKPAPKIVKTADADAVLKDFLKGMGL